MQFLKRALAFATGHAADPLGESRPDIEWVRWIHSPSLLAFTAAVAPKALGKMRSVNGDFLIKTKDGQIYQRYSNKEDGKWSGSIDGEERSFHSAYLNGVVEDAMRRGLEKKTSADEIAKRYHNGFRGIMFAPDSIYDDFMRENPTPPTMFGFKGDYHVPEDYREEYPEFADFLVRKGYGPFWYDRGYDKPEPEDDRTPEV